MDPYNNYYEELYHAGLFSALRGRIRDGHKWITRTGTPGHYVYTYAKDLAGKARSMFGKPRGMFGGNKSGMKSYTKGNSNSRKQTFSMTTRESAENDKREDRFLDRTAKGLAKRASKPDQNGYFNKDAKATYQPFTDTHEFESPNGRVRSARKDVSYTVTTSDYGKSGKYTHIDRADLANTGHRPDGGITPVNRSYTTIYTPKKTAIDRIKEWGANTLSSIRKTANDAAGAVSKGYESAKNWVDSKLASASGKGTSAATGANAAFIRPSVPLSTRQNAVTDKRLDNKTKATIGRWERSHPGQQTWKKDNSIIPQFVADKQRKREQQASTVTSSSLKGGRQSMPSEKRYRVKTTSTGSSYDDGYLKTARKLSGKTYLTDTDQGDWHRNLQAFSKSASQNKNGKASIQTGLMNKRPIITSATAVNGHAKDPIGTSKTVVSKDDERRKKKSNRR